MRPPKHEFARLLSQLEKDTEAEPKAETIVNYSIGQLIVARVSWVRGREKRYEWFGLPDSVADLAVEQHKERKR